MCGLSCTSDSQARPARMLIVMEARARPERGSKPGKLCTSVATVADDMAVDRR